MEEIELDVVIRLLKVGCILELRMSMEDILGAPGSDGIICLCLQSKINAKQGPVICTIRSYVLSLFVFVHYLTSLTEFCVPIMNTFSMQRLATGYDASSKHNVCKFRMLQAMWE